MSGAVAWISCAGNGVGSNLLARHMSFGPSNGCAFNWSYMSAAFTELSSVLQSGCRRVCRDAQKESTRAAELISLVNSAAFSHCLAASM
jgi:hypothetical protein